jgi:competence protein ComEA
MPETSAETPATPSPSIKVYITGEVNKPGVYDMKDNDRVEDAVKAAGGATELADLTRINLAARVADEMQIIIPPACSPDTGDYIIHASVGSSGSGLININTATKAELETLSGIGPAIAQNILDYRETNGPFTVIEDIMKVSRIGAVTFERIKESITV